MGRARIGISGYDYKPWRGRCYPRELPARRWLEYACGVFDSIELNGTSTDGEAVARMHDDRLRRGALVESDARVEYRHAIEVRHESYFHPEFYDMLREHGMGWVVADTAGKFPYAEEVTAGFVYVRLHGAEVLYTSGYGDDELEEWSARIRRWTRRGLDVYVYFDNDAKVHAPHDAIQLMERLRPKRAGTRKKS